MRKQLIQSNIFTQSVINNLSEFQKDIIYLIQSYIDYYSENPEDDITIKYTDYLKLKETTKNDSYSFSEMYSFTEEITKLRGVFYNKIVNEIVTFNIIDSVRISPNGNENIIIKLGYYGKIFFYQKNFSQYLEMYQKLFNNNSKIGYTKLTSNIIKVKGYKRKKLIEILSQYKTTKYYKTSFFELKILLGYITITNIEKSTQKNLFLFEEIQQFIESDSYKTFSHFNNSFLKGAVEYINSNEKIDIYKLRYNTIKGYKQKVEFIEFYFEVEKSNSNLELIKILEQLKLSKNQIKYLMQILEEEEIYHRINTSIDVITRNKSTIYIDISTNLPISNLGGFLYSNVFPELNNKK